MTVSRAAVSRNAAQSRRKSFVGRIFNCQNPLKQPSVQISRYFMYISQISEKACWENIIRQTLADKSNLSSLQKQCYVAIDFLSNANIIGVARGQI